MVDIETGYKGVRRGGVYFLEMRHIVLYFREQFLPMRFNVNVPDTQKKATAEQKEEAKHDASRAAPFVFEWQAILAAKQG